MGLGKTVQVSALLAALLQKKGDATDHQFRPLPCPGILLVVPTSLVQHWKQELRSVPARPRADTDDPAPRVGEYFCGRKRRSHDGCEIVVRPAVDGVLAITS